MQIWNILRRAAKPHPATAIFPVSGHISCYSKFVRTSLDSNRASFAPEPLCVLGALRYIPERTCGTRRALLDASSTAARKLRVGASWQGNPKSGLRLEDLENNRVSRARCNTLLAYNESGKRRMRIRGLTPGAVSAGPQFARPRQQCRGRPIAGIGCPERSRDWQNAVRWGII